jgi:hypothetical protein
MNIEVLKTALKSGQIVRLCLAHGNLGGGGGCIENGVGLVACRMTLKLLTDVPDGWEYDRDVASNLVSLGHTQ